jgi:glycosyltransferase involved in cell wall biosynthesis
MSGARNIVIVAYYFPPLGLAGTTRPLAMANFLASKGHNVTVVTVKDISYPVFDKSLVEKIDDRVKVERVESKDPARKLKKLGLSMFEKQIKAALRGRSETLGFPDSKLGFVQPALQQVGRVIREGGETIVLTTSPPVSVHKVGLLLKVSADIKWVSDWRDIWQSLPVTELSDDLQQRARDYTLDVLRKGHLISATSPKTIDHFSEILPSGNYRFLPNGYDESDFAPERKPTRMSIGLYGTINHLVDIHKVLKWIRDFRAENPQLVYEIRHTGYVDIPGFRSVLDSVELAHYFRCDGYLPHHESIQRIRSNKVNIISLTEKRDTSFIVPSKLFELLRAEPPVIAVLPRGNAARAILERHTFEGVRVTDRYEDFARALEEFLTEPEPNSGWRRNGVDVFERRNQFEHFHEELLKL